MTLAVFSEAPPVDVTDPALWALVPKQIDGGMRHAMIHADQVESYQQAFDELLAVAPPPPSTREELSGWVWVPRQITREMWNAWERSAMVSADEQEDYEEILNAAPRLPSPVRDRFEVLHLAGPRPDFPSSRVLVERGFLGVKHFDTEREHAQWKALPWWRRLFS